MPNHYHQTIKEFYDSLAETEWNRLEWHKMEFAVYWRIMEEIIPPGSTILDCGGGPGRYSFQLAKAGHQVTLFDLSAASITLAKQKSVELGISLAGFHQGNALDLSRFAADSFDTVLLMGPMYHLLELSERRQAVREAVRVLKPGGLLLVTFVTRYAFLLYLLKDDPAQIAAYPPRLIDQLLTDGINLVSEENPGFTHAYFAHPMEISPFMAENGLVQLRLTAVEPLISFLEDSVNHLPRESFTLWADLTYRLGTDPITWGNSEHMLYVGSKV
ncbi:MAG TPA: class I SAM-dependent methyltransferase [Bacillota bacterium]|nr:class I SAM-dependent methyltransferase [Bacillota bacterium]